MATIDQLAEEAERAVSGGIKTDEDRWDRQYTISKINEARAVVARNDYLAHRRWNPSLFQSYYPTYNLYFQSGSCFTRFKLPTGFISADPLRTGCVHIGSSNDLDTFNPLKAKNFLVIKNRTELNDFFRHPRMNPSQGFFTGALLEGLVLEIYSSKPPRNLGLSGVWDDPTALPDYNMAKSQYPLNEDLFQVALTYLKESSLNQSASTLPDTLSDSTTRVIMPQAMSNRANKNLMR